MWETWGGWGGGLAGWGFTGRWGGGNCRGGRGSLGSGATRTWPPPWPPRGLPPPAGRSRQNGVKPSSVRWSCGIKSETTHIPCGYELSFPEVYPPRWSWPLRSQSGFPRLPLPLRSPSPSWSSCPPSCRSQPFLSAVVRKQEEYSQRVSRLVTPDQSGPGSLTFAAFLAFGSGLGWDGFWEKKKGNEGTATFNILLLIICHFLKVLQQFGSH